MLLQKFTFPHSLFRRVTSQCNLRDCLFLLLPKISSFLKTVLNLITSSLFIKISFSNNSSHISSFLIQNQLLCNNYLLLSRTRFLVLSGPCWHFLCTISYLSGMIETSSSTVHKNTTTLNKITSNWASQRRGITGFSQTLFVLISNLFSCPFTSLLALSLDLLQTFSLEWNCENVNSIPQLIKSHQTWIRCHQNGIHREGN